MSAKRSGVGAGVGTGAVGAEVGAAVGGAVGRGFKVLAWQRANFDDPAFKPTNGAKYMVHAIVLLW